MEKLQYDSFYKFLVSLGVILITLPILAMAFIATVDVVLISQNEYENLSSFSQNAIQQKEELLSFVSSWLPIITKIFIPVGAILIFVGGGRWFFIQLQLDDQIKSDTIMKKINAQKMSADEIAIKALGEVSEENTENDDSESTLPNIPYSTKENPVVKYMRIENLCFSNATKKYSKNYHLKKNIRVGKYEYDFVAVSKKDNIDLLFEVKYWRNHSISHISTELAYKLYSMGVNYENTAHRNFRMILMIVTPKQELERIKQYMETKISNAQIGCNIDVQYIAEEDLT